MRCGQSQTSGPCSNSDFHKFRFLSSLSLPSPSVTQCLRTCSHTDIAACGTSFLASEKFGARFKSTLSVLARLWQLFVRAYHEMVAFGIRNQPGSISVVFVAMGAGAKLVCTSMYDHFSAIRSVSALLPSHLSQDMVGGGQGIIRFRLFWVTLHLLSSCTSLKIRLRWRRKLW